MQEVYIKKENLNKWIAKHFDKDIISIDDLIGIIEDLDDEIEYWKEKYEDLEQDLEQNYIHRKRSDYTGDSYDDRF